MAALFLALESLAANLSREYIGNGFTDSVAKLFEVDTLHTIPPSNFIEEWWLGIVKHYGDFRLIGAFFVFMDTFYILGAILFWLCDHFQLLQKYKVQKQKYPTDLDYVQCLMNLLQNYIMLILPATYIAYPGLKSLGFTTALPLPNLWTFALHFYFCMLMEDFTHYWLHRWLHTPWMYKNVHKIHHTYSAPFGLAASYAHPIEVIVLGFCTFSGPLVLRPHYFTFFLFVVLSTNLCCSYSLWLRYSSSFCIFAFPWRNKFS